MKISGVIKTQEQLDVFAKKEADNFYISVMGDVPMYGGIFYMPINQINERLTEIAENQSILVKDIIKVARSAKEEEKASDARAELEDALKMCVKTYVIPFRVH